MTMLQGSIHRSAKIAALFGALAVLASGCAKAPESISPAYVSPIGYQTYSCGQLGEELSRLDAAYSVAAQQQTNARSSDIAGVILLGLPVSTLSGGNVAPEIARLKGEQETVRQTLIRKGCSRA